MHQNAANDVSESYKFQLFFFPESMPRTLLEASACFFLHAICLPNKLYSIQLPTQFRLYTQYIFCYIS